MDFSGIDKEEEEFQVPVKFMKELKDKCEYMSMNPMEYVEKKCLVMHTFTGVISGMPMLRLFILECCLIPIVNVSAIGLFYTNVLLLF